MNPKKSIFDLAASTLERNGYWYFKTATAEVEDLDSRRDVSLAAKWTWIRLKCVFVKSEQYGVLMEDGEPMTIESLAVTLRRRRVDTLKKEIDELLRAKVLKMLDGYIVDPVLVGREKNRLQKLEREQKASENGAEHQKQSSKLKFQHSAGADSSKLQVVDNQDVSENRIQSQLSAKKEERRTSTSIRNEVTNTSTSKVASKDSFASRSDFDGRTRSLADSEENEKSPASLRAAVDFSNSRNGSQNHSVEASDSSDDDRLLAEQAKLEAERKKREEWKELERKRLEERERIACEERERSAINCRSR
jgi:hypothetical protein